MRMLDPDNELSDDGAELAGGVSGCVAGVTGFPATKEFQFLTVNGVVFVFGAFPWDAEECHQDQGTSDHSAEDQPPLVPS